MRFGFVPGMTPITDDLTERTGTASAERVS